MSRENIIIMVIQWISCEPHPIFLKYVFLGVSELLPSPLNLHPAKMKTLGWIYTEASTQCEWDFTLLFALFFLPLRIFLKEIENCIENPELLARCFLKRVSVSFCRFEGISMVLSYSTYRFIPIFSLCLLL